MELGKQPLPNYRFNFCTVPTDLYFPVGVPWITKMSCTCKRQLLTRIQGSVLSIMCRFNRRTIWIYLYTDTYTFIHSTLKAVPQLRLGVTSSSSSSLSPSFLTFIFVLDSSGTGDGREEDAASAASSMGVHWIDSVASLLIWLAILRYRRSRYCPAG